LENEFLREFGDLQCSALARGRRMAVEYKLRLYFGSDCITKGGIVFAQ